MTRVRTVVALGLWGMLVLVVGALIGGGATAGGPNRAGLVVVGEAGAVHSTCVEFSEDEISGADLLRRSGLSVVFSSAGAFGEGVCSLDGTGCSDPGDCFCRCRGGDCAYWAYFRLGDAGWRFQAVGPSQRRLGNGDVDGWVWGDGSLPPGGTSFAAVCPLARAPTATPAAPARPPVQPTAVIATPGAPAPNAGVTPPSDGAPSLEPSGVIATRTQVIATDEPRVVGRPGNERGATSPDGLADEGSGGAPAGLIAFGAVAGALVAGIVGMVVRRRLRV